LGLVRDPQGQVAVLPRSQWLEAAQAALKRGAELDNPDHARILCYTNRALEQLVPLARRAIHGEMADQLPILPGEVLMTRSAVMAPACRAGEEAAEEPDMLLGSNRELVVRDVTPERCDLAVFGVGVGDGLTPTVIETLNAEVEAGETRLTLRLLPPVGSAGRQALDGVMRSLRLQAREAGKQQGRSLWRRYFLVRDAFASLGPAAVLTVHRSQGSTFGEVFIAGDVFWPSDDTLRRQLVYVAVSRASQAVWLSADQRLASAGATQERDRWSRWLKGAS
jgi:exodeoxyribonuclease-5